MRHSCPGVSVIVAIACLSSLLWSADSNTVLAGDQEIYYTSPRQVRLGTISLDVLCSSHLRLPQPYQQPISSNEGYGQVYGPSGNLDRYQLQRQQQFLRHEQLLLQARIQHYSDQVATYRRLNSYRDHLPGTPFLTTLQRAEYNLLQSQLQLEQLRAAQQDQSRRHRRYQCELLYSGVQSYTPPVVETLPEPLP